MDEITFRCSKWINNATAGKFIENDNDIWERDAIPAPAETVPVRLSPTRNNK